MPGDGDEGADGSDGLEMLSIRALKQKLAQRGLDASGCLEKGDLLKRLRESPAPDAAGGARPPAGSTSAAATLATMSVAELRGLLERHDAAGSAAGATEKGELVAALAPCLSRCPICLDDGDGDGDADGSVYRCAGCRAPFHRGCAARHALAAAEEARLPLLCPVPKCRDRWCAPFVAWALDTEELKRYNAAVRSVRAMRQSSGGSGEAASPRTAQALKNLGVRACPRCGAMIEKQAPGLTHGCDKMTCRCGCKFCFRCGLAAGTDGLASCSCVGNHHGYLSHEEVLRNYDSDIFRNIGFPAGAHNSGVRFAGGSAEHPSPVHAALSGVRGLAEAMGLRMMGEVSQAAGGTARGNATPFQPFATPFQPFGQ